jgi:hypothetical protein
MIWSLPAARQGKLQASHVGKGSKQWQSRVRLARKQAETKKPVRLARKQAERKKPHLCMK